jgi:sterol desaturase/sphingolipid hydroxylase (fatty acid hydroxylase superfamily)
MVETVLAVMGQLLDVTVAALCNLVLLGACFSLLAWRFLPCNPGRPWWSKPDLATDIAFAVVPRLINSYGQLILLVIGFGLFYKSQGTVDIATFLVKGHGPLSGMPFWAQVIIYLIGNDLCMYLTHRAFHSARLWRFHAVHHSSRVLEWISATRFHPVDQLFHSSLSDVAMLLLGISPDVLAWLGPWTIASSALVHANLDWTFGPFRYVLASPVFHRWHHTGPERGGNRNFAGTFPVFDILFGTFYMPKGEVPDSFGVDDPDYPGDFLSLLAHPFLRRRDRYPAAAVTDAVSGTIGSD